MAISFDTATSAANTAKNTTSPTLNHTCATSSVLIVVIALDNSGNQPSGVTYNSIAMTQAVALSGSIWQSIWYSTSPTTGSSQAVVATWSGASSCQMGAISLLGCNTSSLIGNVSSTVSTGTGTTSSASFTTANANSWIIDNTWVNGGTPSATAAGTNQTRRINQPAFVGEDTLTVSSTQTTTTAGAYTNSYTISPSELWNTIFVEIKPAVAAAANGNFLQFM